jgi:hypothetical protein
MIAIINICDGSDRHVTTTYPGLPSDYASATWDKTPIFILGLHPHTLFPFLLSLVSSFYRQNLWDQDITSSLDLPLDIAHTCRHNIFVEGFQVSWLTELVSGRIGGRSHASVSVLVLVSSSTHVLGAYIYSIE